MNPTSVLSPEIVDLGLAIGLLQKTSSSVDFDSDWFSDPGSRVSTALADDDRRAALVRFVDTVNGDSPVINAGGVKLLKIFDASELGLHRRPEPQRDAVDRRPPGRLRGGRGGGVVRHDCADHTDRPRRAAVPHWQEVGLDRAAGGRTLRLGCRLADPGDDLVALSGPPDSSGFGLGGVDVSAAVSVTGAAPTVEITLTDLLLPGATSPTTIHIGGPDSSIEESLLSLVLGVVRAGAAALGNAGDEALAALDLIGLGPSPQLTPIDVGDLAAHGVGALRDWFTTTMADPSARLAWLGALHDLIGGSVADGLLSIPLAGGVALTIGLAAQPGPGGHLRVTPQLGVELKTTVGVGPAAVDIKARAAIDVVTVDLADGSLVAVPAAELVVDVAGHSARLIASGPTQIGAVHLGVGVDHGQVVPVLRLLDVLAGVGPAHPVVDLSSADAVVAAAGQIAGDLVRTAIQALPAHVDLEPLLGLTATGGSGVLDSAHLLVDPLGTLAGWWHELLTTHAADVPDVLAHLRDLIAHDSKAAVNGNIVPPIGGTGTATDPWTVPIVDRVSLDAWMAGDRLTLALTVGFRVDTLAGGCTLVETHARAELLSVDFAHHSASLLPAAELAVAMRGKGQPQARLALGPVAVAADSLGLLARWTATTGFAVGLAAPGLVAEVDDVSVPLAFPAGGDWRSAVLDDVERLVGVLAAAQSTGWLNDLVGLVGWSLDAGTHPHRLSLAGLATDPAAELSGVGAGADPRCRPGRPGDHCRREGVDRLADRAGRVDPRHRLGRRPVGARPRHGCGWAVAVVGHVARWPGPRGHHHGFGADVVATRPARIAARRVGPVGAGRGRRRSRCGSAGPGPPGAGRRPR